jgi:hypothetical protein
MVAAAFACLVKFGQNIPLTEDWLMVPPLTGNEPHLLGWLWAQNNEHRVPLPRLLLLGLLKIAHGDFRVGMLFNIASLSLLAFAMILTARRIRHNRTSFSDAFFPIALLHLGNWENLFWSWQLTQVVPTILVCILLLVLVGSRTIASSGTAILVGLSLISLPLCGANGLLFGPLLALWFGYYGVVQWRAAKASGARRSGAGFLVGSAAVTLILVGLYFIGYERPSWTPPSLGVEASIQTAIQFLAIGFGPAARSWWAVSMIAAIVVVLPSAVVAVIGVLRHRDQERQRALGVLVFFGSVAAFTLAIGWGRAGVIPLYGGWPLRYVLLSVPTLCVAYFVWELYGPQKFRATAQNSFFVILLLLLPFNTSQGLAWNDWYQEAANAFEQDLSIGTPPSLLAEHHRDFLFHSVEPSALADLMEMLQRARMGPFATRPQDRVVTQQISYHLPEAGAVVLIWGVNGWNTLPEALRPAGTLVKNNLMQTPMDHGNDNFIARVQAPAGVKIDYGFLITKARDGTPIKEVWDGDYRTVAAQNASADIESMLNLEASQRSSTQESLLTTQQFRYHSAEAGEVFFVWGVNGWNTLPEALRPPGTTIKNNLMMTPMIKEGDTFSAKVQAPSGASVNYGFLITKTYKGVTIKEVWDGRDDYHTNIVKDGTIDVNAAVTLGELRVNIWLLIGISVLLSCVVVLLIARRYRQ